MSAPRPPKTVTHAPARKPKAPVPVVAHRPPAPAAAGVAAAARPAWAAAPAMAFGITGPGGIQLKPVIGAPDDAYEREADRVADQVTSGPAAAPPRITPVTPISLRRPVQRATRDEDEESASSADSPVQRATRGDPSERGEEERSRSSIPAEVVQRATAGDRTDHDDPPLEGVAPRADEAVQRATPLGGVRGGRLVPRDGGPEMDDAAARAIARRGAGAPLEPGVRALIEARLGVDLGHVRVHTDAEARRATHALGARAFTHGRDIWLGRGESPADAKLLAHEATHVVQQGAARASIDATPPSASASTRTETTLGAAPATATSAPTTPTAVTPAAPSAAGRVQRLFLPQAALDRLDGYAQRVPGWALFTVIIGHNPLTGRDVPRTGVNLVRGLLGLVPFGTAIFDKLNEHGLVDRALAWVTGELRRLDLSLDRLQRTIEAAWEDVSITEGLDYNVDVLRRHFRPLYNDVVSFAGAVVDQVVALVKEAAISVAERLLAGNRAWALLKKILGRDPLRDVQVQATPAEILADFLTLIGREEHLRQMRERNTLEETAAWLAEQVATFMGLLADLTSLFGRAWDAIQPANIASLGESLRSLVADAGAFLQRVWDFAGTVAAKVLEFVKKALLGWLASFANDVPGFHLVTVMIRKNPFTDEPVPRTPANLIRGFITLLPNGAAIYARLQETGTVARVAGRIQGAMEALGISWEFVKGIFTGIWNDLSIDDLVHPVDAFNRIVERYGEPVSRLFRFVNVVVREMVSIILEIMNFPSDLVGSIVANAMAAIEDIKRDPIGFLLNMLAAVKRGFANFFDHITTHLVRGLTDWLFRGLRQAGITPPRDLSLRSVLDFVLQVLGVSIERIWQKLGERIGPERVARIRGAIDRLTGIWTFVRDVQQRGVAAIWEHIQTQLSNLWEMVVQRARDWIMERVVNRAIQWMMSLLDITGIMPVINSFVAFFRAIQSAIDYLRDILAIVNDYVATLASVARGDVEPGAQRIEGGLARSIPVAIGFLANQFGLGNLGEKIQEIVGGLRETVDRALDWLLDRAVAGIQSLLASLGLGGGRDADTRLEKDFDATNGSHHELTVDMSGPEPVITVASANPTGVQHQIQDRRDAETHATNPRPLSRQQKAALTRAWNQHRDLVPLVRRLKAAPEANKAGLRTQVQRLMDLLSGNMVAGDAWPNLEIAPSQVNAVPGRVVANPLTRRPGNTVGSAAANVLPNWTAHFPNQTSGSGGNLEWRRVHLLPDRLHGPGNDRNNLIPADENTNGELRRGPEAAAYRRIMLGETLEYIAETTPHPVDRFYAGSLHVSVRRIAPEPVEPVWPRAAIGLPALPTESGPPLTSVQTAVVRAYADLRALGVQPTQPRVAERMGRRSQGGISTIVSQIRETIVNAPRPIHPDLHAAATALGIPY